MVDELWSGGPGFIRSCEAFELGTDSVLLSYFTDASHVRRVCDLGCGSGVIAILLAFANPSFSVDGIELQETSAELARRNIALNDMSDRINIISGDLRQHRNLLTAGSYDLVVSNPPYYAAGSGRQADSASAAVARGENSCTLGDICEAGKYLTRWGGKFALVHKPERLAEVICALSVNGLEPKRLRFVQYKPSSAPSLFMIESRRGGRPSLSVEPPLILANGDGSDTEEIMRIYHRL